MLYFDPLYFVFMLPGLLLAMWAQFKVKSAYARASQIPASSGYSGAQAAHEILQSSGCNRVAVEETDGWLSDHYDPRHRVLRLSPDVYHGRSLAALGIAAHEAGHALQHAQSYAPLTARNLLVPLAGFGSNISYLLIMLGLWLHAFGMIVAGIVLFGGTVVFQLVNLPCEFDASARAKEQLAMLGLVARDEESEVRRVLNAAAMTYVAAVISSLLQLLYYLYRAGLLGGRRED